MCFGKKKTREDIIRENQERHEFWGMDFAPDVPDDDPNKWIDEMETADAFLDDFF